MRCRVVYGSEVHRCPFGRGRGPRGYPRRHGFVRVFLMLVIVIGGYNGKVALPRCDGDVGEQMFPTSMLSLGWLTTQLVQFKSHEAALNLDPCKAVPWNED